MRVRAEFSAVGPTLYINIYVQNILKEAENSFLFEVLAKLGEDKHNKEIQRIVEFFFPI